MKRDMDLVRAILLHIEQRDTGDKFGPVAIDGRDAESVAYHVRIMAQAGLLDHQREDRGLYESRPDYTQIRMAWAGHEFLEAARDETQWQKAKAKVAGAAGGMVFGVLNALLVEYAKKQVGL